MEYEADVWSVGVPRSALASSGAPQVRNHGLSVIQPQWDHRVLHVRALQEPGGPGADAVAVLAAVLGLLQAAWTRSHHCLQNRLLWVHS